MNGSGCKNCPVEKCETLNYRGSVCAAQRAKLGLGDPNDRTDCSSFKDCPYRNDVGWCPENCVQYRHKDDVRVIRCKECWKWYPYNGGGSHDCPFCGYPEENDYCSCGERRTE